jgi:hypothetical protein
MLGFNTSSSNFAKGDWKKYVATGIIVFYFDPVVGVIIL